MGLLKPPPVRVLPLDGSAPAAIADPVSLVGAASRRAPSATVAIDRMEIDELSIAYGPKLAVDRVSLPMRQGEVLALIGPSGCGKTTLLRSLNRLTELTAGTSMRGAIRLDGEDIATFEPTALRRRVTMVFQQPNPFPMSVFDNVAYVLREQAARRPRKRDLRARVRDALTRAGLSTRSQTASTTRRCGSRAASSSGCASRARWPPTLRCCCSTSLAQRWTRSRPR